jgi:hypothetical protein
MVRAISYAFNIGNCKFDGKVLVGATLRKKLDPRKATKTKLKNVAHDIRRIGYIKILYGIKPKWLCRGCS